MFDPFLIVVDLMGEGRVDLNVGFTFSLLFQVFHGERRSCCACLFLAGEEPLETKFMFVEVGTSKIPFSSVSRSEDWEVVLPTSDRVCSEYENHVFPMYDVVFKDMGFRLCFSNFQREVLCWTKLSPSQIHPNFYAFTRAFELVCEYLKIPVFKNVIFFHLSRAAGNRLGFFPSNQKDV